MKENVTLIQQINQLSQRKHEIQLSIEAISKKITYHKQRRGLPVERDGREDLTEEQQRKLQMQEQIEALAAENDDMDQEIAYLHEEQNEIAQRKDVLMRQQAAR